MSKQMPHNNEAELAVIASAIVDPSLMIKLREKLMPNFFYNKVNELVFKALATLSLNNKNIDLITLKEQLIVDDSYGAIGDYSQIVSLAEDITIAVNIEEYINIVYEKFLIRETISRASNIMNNAYNTDQADMVIEFAEKEIFNLARLTRSAEFVDWNKLIDDTYLKIEELVRSDKKKMTGVATGFSNLDKLTNGLQKSDLIIIAARPSVGKTAFALNIARNALIHKMNNEPSIAFFSLEMGADQLLTRLLAAQSGVSITNLRTGNLSLDELEEVSFSMEFMKKFKFHVDETPGIKIGDLKSKARKLKLENGLDMILIDYLQLITTANNSDNRQQEVSEISRELKGLAKELQVPIVALSQLSRGVEQRADKKPMMSDIRESGAIEQDADIIMMLYRPEYYGSNIEIDEEVVEGKTMLIISKNRNGATGELEFKFEKTINMFLAIDNNYD